MKVTFINYYNSDWKGSHFEIINFYFRKPYNSSLEKWRVYICILNLCIILKNQTQ